MYPFFPGGGEDDYSGHFSDSVALEHTCVGYVLPQYECDVSIACRPPTWETLFSGNPPNPGPNPHLCEVNTLITTFSSHHFNSFPFGPTGLHKLFDVFEVTTFL